MRAFLIAGLLMLSGYAQAQTVTMDAGLDLIDRSTMNTMQLRSGMCGDQGANQDAKNLRFTGCTMFIFGAVEMLREWQKSNPAQAPKVCVPRNVRAGDLIIAVQQYIEANRAWQNNSDATTVIVAALKARWPCA
jgi:hypothetical protein